MQINGSWIPLSKYRVADALGQPQFRAEDGDVYLRGHHAVKVYTDPETGRLAGVDFLTKRVNNPPFPGIGVSTIPAEVN